MYWLFRRVTALLALDHCRQEPDAKEIGGNCRQCGQIK
jgi:hypothetical protein